MLYHHWLMSVKVMLLFCSSLPTEMLYWLLAVSCMDLAAVEERLEEGCGSLQSLKVTRDALWPWGYPYRWLPLLGFRELVPIAAIPTDLFHTVLTSHSAGHAAIPPPGVSPVAVVLLVMLLIYIRDRLVPLNRAPHLSVWQLWLSCMLFPDRWIAGGYASLWPAPRGSKTMTPTQM